jgi:hypothetical protein
MACCWVTSSLALSWACGVRPVDKQGERDRIECEVHPRPPTPAGSRHPLCANTASPECKAAVLQVRVTGKSAQSSFPTARMVAGQCRSLGLKTQFPAPLSASYRLSNLGLSSYLLWAVTAPLPLNQQMGAIMLVSVVWWGRGDDPSTRGVRQLGSLMHKGLRGKREPLLVVPQFP